MPEFTPEQWEAFDPDNPKHVKGFFKMVKKMSKKYKDKPGMCIVFPAKFYKKYLKPLEKLSNGFHYTDEAVKSGFGLYITNEKNA